MHILSGRYEMQRADQSTAVCQIFTYKAGMLSGLAHDLRIEVGSFGIDLGGTDHFISARFDTRSLRVDCVMANGRESPDILSPREKDDINNNIIREVLHTETYPEIVLISSAVSKQESDYLVTGKLGLHGQTREISFVVREEDNKQYVADVCLHLPDFGIVPFSTLFGAIRIKPDVLIHIVIPAEHVPDDALA
jgi:hypothetical protein